MFDCNLIKSKVQKLQEEELPNLQIPGFGPQAPPVPFIPELPQTPPVPQMPMMPRVPAMPATPPMPTVPRVPATPPMPTIPQTPAPVMPMPPAAPQTPGLFPSQPIAVMPPNPLLPPHWPNTIDYESLQYLNGYLRTQIGRYVEVEFLIGTSNRVIWVGILAGVGINYILLQDAITNDITACDFYNIKFVKSYTLDPVN